MSNLRNIWSSLFARPGSGNACYVILAVPGSRGNTRQVMDTGPRTAHSADLLSPLYETQVTQKLILRVPVILFSWTPAGPTTFVQAISPRQP